MTYSNIGVFLLVLGQLLACSGGQFSGEKKESKGEPERNSGDETADDPVAVGGAYLACAYLTQPTSGTGAADIGCVLNNKSSGQKSSLDSLDQNSWSLYSNGAVTSYPIDDGSSADRFHKRISYTDNSYMQQTLRVDVSDNGRSYSYQKNLSKLDASLDAVSESGETALTYEARIYSTDTTCNVENGCSLFQATMSLMVCTSGNFNKFAAYGAGLGVDSPSSGSAQFPLGAGICVHMAKVQTNGGCLMVPVTDKTTQKSYVYVLEKNDFTNKADADKKFLPFACQ